MKHISKKVKVALLALLTLTIAVGFVTFDEENFEIAKNLDIYHTLFRELNLYYVDDTDPGDLVKESIDEMLKSLDPYTVYIPESKIEDYKFMTTGKYGGIGALIRQKEDYVLVSEPYEGFPAQKAGILAGDKIIAVDGKSTKGNNTKEISELLKGEPGTTIELSILRYGLDKPIKKEIKREKIAINSVPYYGMLTDEIGYIRLNSFTEKCSKEVEDAFVELKKEHDMKQLVFDLRGNPGGLLMEAVAISNLFVPKGQDVVSTKGKVTQWNRTYKAPKDPLDTEIPIVMLVNSGSASASEIVSGVIQDLDRGVVVGKRTYGKGLVQATRDLSYNSKLKLTTAKYYIPSGRCIQALDYTHRNEDGSVGRVPDSLITEFTTKAGRKVYDGGGVMPDVEIEPRSISKMSISLYSKSLIFDYATKFYFENESIPAVSEFSLSEEQYNDFVAYLQDKDFDYTLESELLVNELEEVIKKEKLENGLDELLVELKQQLKHDKNKDLEKHKEEVADILREEIIGRYYYQKGMAEAILLDDPNVEKAIELLQDSVKYNEILTVK